MKTPALFLVLSLVLALAGCSVYSAPGAGSAPVCEWPEETGFACLDGSTLTHTTERYEEQGGDMVCLHHSYWCGDVADACRREAFECQPARNWGQP